jgi:hypothetical protein
MAILHYKLSQLLVRPQLGVNSIEHSSNSYHKKMKELNRRTFEYLVSSLNEEQTHLEMIQQKKTDVTRTSLISKFSRSTNSSLIRPPQMWTVPLFFVCPMSSKSDPRRMLSFLWLIRCCLSVGESGCGRSTLNWENFLTHMWRVHKNCYMIKLKVKIVVY